MRKDALGCFLCEMPVKGKRFTFYSGVMKGGSTTRLLTCTVTVFERWQNLTIHEIQVCRWCQQRLWRRQQLVPMILFGIGASVMLFLTLAGLVLLPGVIRFVALVPAVLVALGLAVPFAVYLCRYLFGRPKYAQLEPLIMTAAMVKLPERGHTYMTTDQYLERQRQGIF